ncbi:MAG: hypothetical protein KAH57_05385 [Thermoplasmata archaeon]|nr:hypothetical protein [Thermoplasmata archaeon]
MKLQKRSKGGERHIPVDIIGNYLIRLQNLVNHCGEYLSEKPFRTRGKTPKDIQKKCRLLMKGAKISSFDQSLILEDDQTVLYGDTLGIESIKLSSDLLNSVGIEDPDEFSKEFHKRIDISRYRNRLTKDLNSLIPGRGEGVNLIIQTRGVEEITLGYEKKTMVKEILKRTKNEDIELVGVLSQMRVTQGPKKIELTSPEGKIKIKYSRDWKDDLIEHLKKGKPIQITGTATLKEDDTIEVLEKIKDIREANTIKRHRIVSEEFDMKLKNPLFLTLDYHEDQWIMTNDKLSIHSQHKDYQNCLKEAEDEFAFIFNEYINTPDNELTKDALQLKRYLQTMIPES